MRPASPEEWISKQIKAGLNSIAKDKIRKIAVACEPVGVIGASKATTPEQRVHLCRHRQAGRRKDHLSTFILYGGSMNEKHAFGLLAQLDTGGSIVGTSLASERFIKTIEVANQSNGLFFR